MVCFSIAMAKEKALRLKVHLERLVEAQASQGAQYPADLPLLRNGSVLVFFVF